jgi:hypothetical protein
MNDHQDMTDDQKRLLHLEAKVLQMQCQIVGLRQTVLGYFHTKGVHFGQTPADVYNMQAQQKALEDLLRALADFDPARASQISRILLPPKDVPPSA